MDGNGILINIIMTEINLMIDTMFNQVAQCAGCNVYEPWAAMVIGAGAAFVYLCIHTLMIRWQIKVAGMLVVVLLIFSSLEPSWMILWMLLPSMGEEVSNCSYFSKI